MATIADQFNVINTSNLATTWTGTTTNPQVLTAQAPPPPKPRKVTALEWLDERVREMRDAGTLSWT